jgi:hypothetical protein
MRFVHSANPGFGSATGGCKRVPRAHWPTSCSYIKHEIDQSHLSSPQAHISIKSAHGASTFT